LAIFEDWSGVEGKVAIGAGDTLLAFSDGAMEAGIEDGKELGEDGLAGVLQAHAREPVEAVIDGVIRAANAISHDHLADDLTLIALRGL
ncbi:MAG: serine/threonine-protein phosphatase, partial [Roseomonas sp.]|nr:serine/threonine-protein phosphatase [Roseomonas sp.]